MNKRKQRKKLINLKKEVIVHNLFGDNWLDGLNRLLPIHKPPYPKTEGVLFHIHHSFNLLKLGVSLTHSKRVNLKQMPEPIS